MVLPEPGGPTRSMFATVQRSLVSDTLTYENGQSLQRRNRPVITSVCDVRVEIRDRSDVARAA